LADNSLEPLAICVPNFARFKGSTSPSKQHTSIPPK